MKKVRVLLGILSIILLAWFILPICFSVSLNLGNMTGILASVMLLVYAVWMPKIHSCAAEWSKNKKSKWIVNIVVCLISIIAALVLIESGCMIRAACRKPNESATVIVLGCRVYGERASLSMVERLEAAYEYLYAHEGSICILSGGQGEGENISEAECMYRWLVKKGVEPERLIKEEDSVSTRENLAFSKKLIEENGLNPEIAIATSEYHQYRAGRIAKTLDMKYGAICGHTAFWLFPTYYVRELYGILYEWIS